MWWPGRENSGGSMAACLPPLAGQVDWIDWIVICDLTYHNGESI